MSLSLLTEPPRPPAFRVPWDELQTFEWVRALEPCPQDPIHHAEGNVWIHTRMVLETLVAMPAWRALSADDQAAVWLACLLHDVAKPFTTKEEPDGRITAKGHSRAGEMLARRLLWELGAPFSLREMVSGLIRHHQIPFYLIERDDAQKLAAEISLVCRADLLALVAEADIRGRVCQDMQRIVDNIELFRAFCAEEGCFDKPRSFPSDHTRVVYFRSEGRSPDVPVHDDTSGEMIMMCGLPGAGKDTCIRERFPDLPVVSLDELRSELDVEPDENQGAVVQAGKERVREHLRRGERFVYNATNLNRQRRGPLLSLAADYGARVRIVYVEAPRAALLAGNRARAARVPEAVIRRMSERWEVPSLLEAHALDVVLR
ncbi:AAA family ATPase [Polyangium sp. 6x1]|uniref:AAA family ATPase n=1 Tax=Polyangium sp. 6x1 TaxID=3042689 RepID=UPI002482F0E4|nr:AAA family ATPase [Polyangium sp. 6x1]MDI1442884.1 AAA family ATPase [Polyangium sp. 6x1]